MWCNFTKLREIGIYPALVLLGASRNRTPEIPPVAAVRSLAAGLAGGLAYSVDRPRTPAYSLAVPLMDVLSFLDATGPRLRFGYLPPETACRGTRQMGGLGQDKQS